MIWVLYHKHQCQFILKVLFLYFLAYINSIRSGFRRAYGSYGNWESLFQQMDTDNDNHITSREFYKGLINLNIKLPTDVYFFNIIENSRCF